MLKHLHKYIWILSSLMLSAGGLLSNVYAETTATQDETAEVVVLKKMINQQLNQNNTNISSVPIAPQSKQENTQDTDQLSQEIPKLEQPIIDQANLLNQTEYAQLSQYIRDIYDSGKAQIGLVIVTSTGQDDIFSYAMHVAEKWQLGTAKYDNGLLIVVAVNDRRIQILTGYGLEGILPDIITHRIIQNQITPYFKQGQYSQGLQAGLTEINHILNQDPELARQAAESLKQQQAEAHRQQQAQENTFGLSLFILVIAVFTSYLIGRKTSALGAGIAGTAIGLFNGMEIIMSLILGFGLFFLVISSIAQLIFQALASSSGGGRGGRGGSSGGGSYRGGGGGFGGGGASGSW